MPDDHVALPKANRIGLLLFVIYLAGYAGFMYLAAFKSSLLAKEALAGINLAVVYGMTLIVGAFVLAIIYLFTPVHGSEDEP
jgi:uncharacterized membrane protein (DUF485 family)